MGNFCIGDEGVNGIADRKHKKISSLGSSFLPKGPKGKNGDPWEEIFLCLRSAIPFMPKSPMQKLHLYIGAF